HALVEATVQRSRPVVLTALAAVLAFIPLTFSAFWGSLAYTLIGGTAVGTLLNLIFLPALYSIWLRVKPAEGGQPIPEIHIPSTQRKSGADALRTDHRFGGEMGRGMQLSETIAHERLQVVDFKWRRDRDSNPGGSFPPTRFPSVRLQPLGHLSGAVVYPSL